MQQSQVYLNSLKLVNISNVSEASVRCEIFIRLWNKGSAGLKRNFQGEKGFGMVRVCGESLRIGKHSKVRVLN